jgi:hypothetical protein
MIGIIIMFAVVATIEGILIYLLQRKIDNLSILISQRLKTLNENCETLRKNDDILSNDIELLFREYKKTIKEGNKQRRPQA